MKLDLDAIERDVDALSGPWSALGGEKEIVYELLDRARALESLRRACERAIGEMDAGRRADARCTLVVELNEVEESIGERRRHPWIRALFSARGPKWQVRFLLRVMDLVVPWSDESEEHLDPLRGDEPDFIDRLSAKTAMTPRQVRRWLKVAVEQGWLKRDGCRYLPSIPRPEGE